jgi:hypothetical protein
MLAPAATLHFKNTARPFHSTIWQVTVLLAVTSALRQAGRRRSAELGINSAEAMKGRDAPTP